MPYEQDGSTLYCKEIVLKNVNKKQKIYFFSKNEPKSGEPCDLPDNKVVGKNEKTGFMYLKNK